MNMRRLLLLMLSVAALTGCTSKLKKENEALASEIAERREALKEHQQQSLKDAQRELAVTDSLLEDATRRYDELHRLVMEHAATMNDASPEVVELNGLRRTVDSLKERFEVLAETIKYIRKKM
jgi:chromosome segregation ATPase